MQFTNATFKRSFARFRKSLKENQLELNLSSAQDVWAQIIFGNKFSAASASLNRHGSLRASNVSWEKIAKLMNLRSREVNARIAYALFGDAVRDDLRELSEAMHDVVKIVSTVDGSCVISAINDELGLGLLINGQPGYLPVSSLDVKEKTHGEFEWLRVNSDIAVEIINTTAGIGSKQFGDIFASSSREAKKKSDAAFSKYFSKRVETTAQFIATNVFAEFNVRLEDEFDFDQVRDEVVEVIDEVGEGAEWVSSDCDAAEALIDHVTARVRATLQWLSYPDEAHRSDESIKASIDEAVQFAMRKFFKD